MELFIILAIACACGFGGYNLAKSKNRNVELWTILCAIFGLIPLIIIACLPANEK